MTVAPLQPSQAPTSLDSSPQEGDCLVRTAAPFVFSIVALLAPASARAQQPATPLQTQTTRLVPVAGTLVDAAGAPMTGDVSVTFSLYDAREGGTELWTETQQLRLDARGQYTAYLGAAVPLPQTAFRDEQARWLETSAAGRAAPRAMLVAVPYALRAADADTLGGTPLSSFGLKDEPSETGRAAAGATAEPLVDGSGVPNQLAKFATANIISSSTITETAANRIGIGTTDPTEAGQLDS